MMEGWSLLPMMAQLRCGILSGKSLYAISEDIEVDCFVSCGPLWIQTASTQGQMTSVCTDGSLPCRNILGLLKARKVLN
ncbi:gem nuclear organelle associated protein 5 [Rhinolophus ferrumequinum]|uniref:Gem nuclear organelle associated protein 5 n=1 Tax=Rhinolophus ferrumequinum TaxID=59479 RepID=A0A7J7RXI7_RHIFE|nr:gem nuclear organelle associated protein 5 [Rhinolophus ferrumequinum]